MLSRKFFLAPRSWCLGIGGSLYMVTDLLPRKRLPFLPGAVSDAQNEATLVSRGAYASRRRTKQERRTRRRFRHKADCRMTIIRESALSAAAFDFAHFVLQRARRDRPLGATGHDLPSLIWTRRSKMTDHNIDRCSASRRAMRN
jgi:hypothetical protein